GQTFAYRDYHDKACRLQPDCYGAVTAKGHCYPFFLLWDNGLTPMMLERHRVRSFEKAHYFDHFGFNYWTFHWVAIVASTPPSAQQYRERLRTASSGGLRAFVIDQITLAQRHPIDRKSTRLNSSHGSISYAV